MNILKFLLSSFLWAIDVYKRQAYRSTTQALSKNIKKKKAKLKYKTQVFLVKNKDKEQ